jgi:hypothetical protein
LLAGGRVMSLSIPAAAGMLCVSLAVLAARPDDGIMRQVSATTPGGRFTRWWATGVVAGTMILGFVVNLARHAGLSDFEVMLALLTTLMIPVGLLFVYLTARAVDHAHRALESKTEAERQLRVGLEKLDEATRAVADEAAALPRSDVRALLSTIVLQARALTHAAYGAIGIGDDPCRAFDPWVSSGVSEKVERTLAHPPRPVGVLGRIARNNEIVRTADVMAEPSFGGFPPGHPPMHSFLGVPITFQGVVLGNLYLAEKHGASEFSLEDQRVIESLAARAGSALQTAHAFGVESSKRTWLKSVIEQMPEGVVVVDHQAASRSSTEPRAATRCRPRARRT